MKNTLLPISHISKETETATIHLNDFEIFVNTNFTCLKHECQKSDASGNFPFSVLQQWEQWKRKSLVYATDHSHRDYSALLVLSQPEWIMLAVY